MDLDIEFTDEKDELLVVARRGLDQWVANTFDANGEPLPELAGKGVKVAKRRMTEILQVVEQSTNPVSRRYFSQEWQLFLREYKKYVDPNFNSYPGAEFARLSAKPDRNNPFLSNLTDLENKIESTVTTIDSVLRNYERVDPANYDVILARVRSIREWPLDRMLQAMELFLVDKIESAVTALWDDPRDANDLIEHGDGGYHPCPAVSKIMVNPDLSPDDLPPDVFNTPAE